MWTLGRIVSFREYLLREDILNGVILQYSLSLRWENIVRYRLYQ